MLEEVRWTAREKALQINIDGSRHGTFAEIGGGQEVARWFFHVGGAAGTVAKTMSAYDMAVSDAIYGPCARYVSRQRLKAMLDHEWALLLERLSAKRGDSTRFFVFADTVATRSYTRSEDGRGWLGIRFQDKPRGEPSEILIHARMWDCDNAHQQEALGLLGVNLCYGACFLSHDPIRLIGSLMDELTRDRMEVDTIKFSGPAFTGVDNRLMSLQLVHQRLTNAAVFTADGEVVEPAEVLHKKPVLIERGSFRPVTNVTLDMIDGALAEMRDEPELKDSEPVILMEMTLRHLLATGTTIDFADYLARVDTLSALGRMVMISNYSRFHNVAMYLRRYTRNLVGMVLGVPTLEKICDERFYSDLEGGVLEALGRLFRGRVKLYLYPWRSQQTGELVTADNFRIAPGYEHLYAHLRENRFVVPIRRFKSEELTIFPGEVLGRIQAGDPTWERMVPAPIVPIIKQNHFFGCGGTREATGPQSCPS